MAETIRVDVSAPVLRWALERSRKASEIGRRFPGLAAWLSGEKKPTLRQVEELAKAARVPLGWALLLVAGVFVHDYTQGLFGTLGLGLGIYFLSVTVEPGSAVLAGAVLILIVAAAWLFERKQVSS